MDYLQALLLFGPQASALLSAENARLETASARKGNAIGACGMLVAIVGISLSVIGQHADSFNLQHVLYILIGLGAGGLVGAITAFRVQMTSMPEMVALFNGSGGVASLLVAWASFHYAGILAPDAAPVGAFTASTLYLAALIGGLTFSGSIVAFGKLSGKITTKPVLYSGQNVVNAGIVLALLAGMVCFYMPVVISLLNSYWTGSLCRRLCDWR